jgi:6,7-dimethyl-8-ribityllumazine synthase
MSGSGAPETLEQIDGAGLSVVVVAGTWHERITEGLIAGASRLLDASGADYSVVRVPGSFELAVVAKAAFESGADAVVALGVIIRGGTPHFDFVASATTEGLNRVALDAGKPVGFGVLTLDDEQQGLDRAGLAGSKEDKGAEAAHAALHTALVVRQLQARRPAGFGRSDAALSTPERY